jgi:DNA-binding PadR family transcriptional regulator
MSAPLTLLGLLERESSYGYDLKRDYDTYFGWVGPSPSVRSTPPSPCAGST